MIYKVSNEKIFARLNTKLIIKNPKSQIKVYKL